MRPVIITFMLASALAMGGCIVDRAAVAAERASLYESIGELEKAAETATGEDRAALLHQIELARSQITELDNKRGVSLSLVQGLGELALAFALGAASGGTVCWKTAAKKAVGKTVSHVSREGRL